MHQLRELEPCAVTVSIEQYDLINRAKIGCTSSAVKLEAAGFRLIPSEDPGGCIHLAVGVVDMPDGVYAEYLAEIADLIPAGDRDQAFEARRALDKARGAAVMEATLWNQVQAGNHAVAAVLTYNQLCEVHATTLEEPLADLARASLRAAGFQVSAVDFGQDEEVGDAALVTIDEIATGLTWMVDARAPWSRGWGDEPPPYDQPAAVH